MLPRLEARSAVYEAPAQMALDLRGEVTLEAWVRADRMGQGGGRILDKSAPGTQPGYMLDTFPGNSLRFLNAKGMCTYAAKLPGNRWSHVAGVYSASRKIMKLYLDGREVASLGGDNFPPMTLSTVPLHVGCDPEGGQPLPRPNPARGGVCSRAERRRNRGTRRGGRSPAARWRDR